MAFQEVTFPWIKRFMTTADKPMPTSKAKPSPLIIIRKTSGTSSNAASGIKEPTIHVNNPIRIPMLTRLAISREVTRSLNVTFSL